jgi:RNA-binding motif X-linked protein 2
VAIPLENIIVVTDFGLVIGGLSYELTEGDLLTIFSQYGNPVHVNLIRDKETGKSKGFAYLKYEDQRSTWLAVDNFNGAEVMGRKIRVDHTRYQVKEGEEDLNAAMESIKPKSRNSRNQGDERDHRHRSERHKRNEHHRSPRDRS